MKPQTQEILNKAVNLPPIERAELLESIIESFDVEQDEEIKKAWADEAERRVALHKKDPSGSLLEEDVYDMIENIKR